MSDKCAYTMCTLQSGFAFCEIRSFYLTLCLLGYAMAHKPVFLALGSEMVGLRVQSQLELHSFKAD